MSELRVVRMLLPLLSGQRWALPAIVALGVAASLAEGVGLAMFVPLLQTVAAEDSPGGGDESVLVSLFDHLLGDLAGERRLLVLTFGIFAAVTVRALLAYANDAVFARLEARISHRLRSGLFHLVMDVDYSFIQRNDSGRFVNAMANEVWKATEALALFVRMLVNGSTVVIYAVLLLLLSWELTIGVGVALALISFLVRFLTRRVDALSTVLTRDSAALASRMLEGTNGARVIRAFAQERAEKRRFDQGSERVSATLQRLALVRASVNPIYEILAAAILMAILYTSLRNDPGTLPALLVFVVVLYRLQPKLTALDRDRVRLVSTSGSVREVLGLIDTTDKPHQPDGATDASGLRPEFVLDDVSFHYPESASPALDGISLTIPSGRTTALVGPSGGGKSTLTDLLLRLYDPVAGQVTFGGVPMQDLHRETLRARVAVVSQQVFLFDASVRDNIAYGCPDATMEMVEDAARLAHAHEFVRELPEGYATVLGEGGLRLSGGQRQRLTLARAILRDPDVLILDEATNALDSISEQVIQDALELLSKDRTVVVVAHRLSTVRRAHQVVVLRDGVVAEVGTAEELQVKGGLFAELSRTQRASAGG